jgi:hypothetical protein
MDNIVIGKTCPYCQTPIKPGAPAVVCSVCGMPHHAECWQENGRCTTFGCNGGAAGSAAAQAAPVIRRTHDGHVICPICEYVMTPFDATCPRCENLRRQGRVPAPPAAPPHAQPYGTVPPPPAAAYPHAHAPYPMSYECPYDLRQWNWGAFAIPVIWSAAMNQWLWFVLCFVPYVNWVAPFYLAIKGNELAWKSRQWMSVEHFRSTQEVWNKWGIVLFVIWIILLGCGFMAGILGSDF